GDPLARRGRRLDGDRGRPRRRLRPRRGRLGSPPAAPSAANRIPADAGRRRPEPRAPRAPCAGPDPRPRRARDRLLDRRDGGARERRLDRMSNTVSGYLELGLDELRARLPVPAEAAILAVGSAVEGPPPTSSDVDFLVLLSGGDLPPTPTAGVASRRTTIGID